MQRLRAGLQAGRQVGVWLLMLVVVPAFADSHDPVRDLVSLSVDAKEDVDNDLLIVRMFIEREGKKQADTAVAVNREMAWALAKAQAVAVVKAQTQGYSSSPLYHERRITAWRTRQVVRLESTDTDALTALIGDLQEKLAVESIAYAVSDGVRRVVEERLIATAIRQYRTRAEQVAREFGRTGYNIVNTNINTRGAERPPVVFARKTMARAESAPPAVAAGEQSMVVTVNGTIELTDAPNEP